MGLLLDTLALEFKTQVGHAVGRKEAFLGGADAVCSSASTLFLAVLLQ